MNCDDIIKCMQLCINSYCGSYGSVEKVLNNKWTKTVYGHYEACEDNTVYLVFPGTSKGGGWENNFDYQQMKIHKGYVHKGFWNDELFKAERVNEITDYVADKKPLRVIITGHSQGASIALLCAYYLRTLYPKLQTDCVAFAPARVGDPKFRRSFKETGTGETHIFTNGRDIVAKLPTRWIFGIKYKGYFRLGATFTLLKYRHPVRPTQIGRRWYYRLIPFGSVLHHFPQEYMKNLKKWKDKNEKNTR